MIGETQVNSGSDRLDALDPRADRGAHRRHALLPRPVRRRVLLPLRLQRGDRADGAVGHRPRRRRARRRARPLGRSSAVAPLAGRPGHRGLPPADRPARGRRRPGRSRRRPTRKPSTYPTSSRSRTVAAPVEWSERALVLDVKNLTKSFGGLVAVNDVSFHVRRGRDPRDHRPERRRQDDALQPHHRPDQAGLGSGGARGRGHHRGGAVAARQAGHRPLVPADEPVLGAVVAHERDARRVGGQGRDAEALGTHPPRGRRERRSRPARSRRARRVRLDRGARALPRRPALARDRDGARGRVALPAARRADRRHLAGRDAAPPSS